MRSDSFFVALTTLQGLHREVASAHETVSSIRESLKCLLLCSALRCAAIPLEDCLTNHGSGVRADYVNKALKIGALIRKKENCMTVYKKVLALLCPTCLLNIQSFKH